MPRFGCDTIGDLSGIGADYYAGSWFTCPETGLASSISAYLDIASIGDRFKFALYKKSDSSFFAGTEEFVAVGTGLQWGSANFAVSPELENVDYWIVVWGKQGSSPHKVDEAGKGGYATKPYNSWADPHGFTPIDNKYSIYCTYNGEEPPIVVAIPDTEINPVVTKAAGGGGLKTLGPEVEINPTYVVNIRGKMVGLPPGLIELLDIP